MLPPFDIFRVDAHCEVIWVKSAADLKSARLAVKALMQSSPGEYHAPRFNCQTVASEETEGPAGYLSDCVRWAIDCE